jgi:starch synthase
MNLRVLFVSTEFRPLLKVGGLADVSTELPAALAALGHDVRVLLPRIAGMPGGERVGKVPGIGRILEHRDGTNGVRLWLLDTPGFRRRSRLYAREDGSAWPDDAERFDELCRVGALLADDALGMDWRADVVHANDWACGLLPLRLQLGRVPAASVFAIHNLAHQGLFSLETAARLGLPGWVQHPDALEFWDRLSLIKAGLNFADRLVTVSPRYAREIQMPALGEGLDGLLRRRSSHLHGILNGIDRRCWDPRRDPALAAGFGPANLAGKARCKQALLAELGFPSDAADAPLAAMVTRLVLQKGIDLVLDALPHLLARGLRLVVLGSGEAALQDALRDASARHPGQVVVRFDFDDALARRIYAGSDLFLMPSRFEPCGLGQLIALRYGSVPVVHAVGGLADTVQEPDAGRDGNGFCFDQATSADLCRAIDRALEAYSRRDAWKALVQRALASRFDWKGSARTYVDVYRRAIVDRRRQILSPAIRHEA